MACDVDDREGESPSPMEPDWGGRSTARRPVAAVNKLFRKRPVFVKRGIGTEIVAITAEHARATGCEWLHVDFGEHPRPFYLDACGFRPAPAGLIAS
jgi:hypothetical protein